MKLMINSLEQFFNLSSKFKSIFNLSIRYKRIC